MKSLGLQPNGQTVVNMMLAHKLSGSSKEKAEQYFQEGVRLHALQPVMRLDTEFAMWWSQLERMGSFTSKSGFLSVNKEGAKPMPGRYVRTVRVGQQREKIYDRERADTVGDSPAGAKRELLFGNRLYKVSSGAVGTLPWDVANGLPRAFCRSTTGHVLRRAAAREVRALLAGDPNHRLKVGSAIFWTRLCNFWWAPFHFAAHSSCV